MKNPLPTDDVERRLQDEARGIRTQTQFSPLLHERVMASLRDCGLHVDSPMPSRRRRILWQVAIPTGIAAAIAVATWIALHPSPPPTTPIARPTPRPIPQVPMPEMPKNSTEIATNALEQGKFAYLDRDANRLMTFVTDQIPSFPQPK